MSSSLTISDRSLNRLIVDLPFPPSVNKAYRTVMAQGRVFRARSRELREWDSVARLLIKAAAGRRMFSTPVSVGVRFFAPDWWTKAGKPRKRDVDGPIKALLDALAVCMYPDDRLVFNLTASKAFGPKEKAVVFVENIPTMTVDRYVIAD